VPDCKQLRSNAILEWSNILASIVIEINDGKQDPVIHSNAFVYKGR